jgi:hypothetical protein
MAESALSQGMIFNIRLWRPGPGTRSKGGHVQKPIPIQKQHREVLDELE